MHSKPHQFSRVAEELIGDFMKISDGTPASMHRRPTKDLGALMRDLVVKYKIGVESEEAVIRDHWAEITGPNARYSHPAGIDKRGWLLVLVSNSVARSELFMYRELILSKVRRLPGCAHVKALNIRAG